MMEFAVAMVLLLLAGLAAAKWQGKGFGLQGGESAEVAEADVAAAQARWHEEYGTVPHALIELYATRLVQRSYIMIDGHPIDAFLSPSTARAEAQRRDLPATVVPFAIAAEPVPILYVVECENVAEGDGPVRIWGMNGGLETVFPSIKAMRGGAIEESFDRTI